MNSKSWKPLSHTAALRFVLLLGIVSLLADVTYEGARSITAPTWGCWAQWSAWWPAWGS